jgi:hypothetical protein
VLQTDDLFLGALGLVRGGELVRAFVRGTNGRRVAVFEIVGPGMDDIERDYYGGRSLVDLRLFKSEVARLKNVAFAALRGEERPQAEPPCRPSGIDSREGGRPRTRSAEDANVGARGAARIEEERRDESQSGRDRRDQAAERPQRSRQRAWD